MTNAAALRDKATHLRVLAREYASDVGQPLYVKARLLERLAAVLERSGNERRQPRLTLKEIQELSARRVFGRRKMLPIG